MVIGKEKLEYLRKTYAPGTRVRLEYMDDVQALPLAHQEP